MKLFISLILFVLISFFQNCSSSKNTENVNESDNNSESLNICGYEGFKVIHKNYFLVHCSSCHQKGGFAFPSFADKDVNTSYQWARSIDPQKLWNNSIKNQFCGESCALKVENPIYHQLESWLNNPDRCP